MSNQPDQSRQDDAAGTRAAALQRRGYAIGGGVDGPQAAGLSHMAHAMHAEAPAREAPGPARAEPAGTLRVTLRVNGRVYDLRLDPRTTLLDCLRDHLHLSGTKKGCDHGQCGACTVHVNGRRVNACLSLAAMREGDEITTIEGLGTPEHMHPMQAAFVEHDAYQCGYCTAGQIMSATALLHEPIGAADADLREAMSGNLCRCGAYPNIVAAIQCVRKGA